MRWAAQLEARIARGEGGIEESTPEDDARAAITVRELAEKFRHEYVSPTVRDIDFYRRQAWSVLDCHVLPQLGDKRAHEVTRKNVVEMRDALNRDKKHNRTVQKALVQLSKLYNWAIDLELVTCENPARRVPKPRTESSTEFYTRDEVARLLAEAAEHHPELHAPIAFAFYVGARKGELAALRWGDVELDVGRVIIRRSWDADARKSGKPVTVVLHPHLLAILKALRGPEERSADELVFSRTRPPARCALATAGARPTSRRRSTARGDCNTLALFQARPGHRARRAGRRPHRDPRCARPVDAAHDRAVHAPRGRASAPARRGTAGARSERGHAR